MEDEVEGDDDAPVAANAVKVPGDLFRQIPRPDDEELREGEIDVEHHESKGELAKVVLLGLTQNGLEWFGLGNDPVDHRGRHGERVDKNPRPAEVLHLLDPHWGVRRRILVAFESKPVEPPHVESPDNKAEHAYHHEHFRLQHGPLEDQAVRLNLVDESSLERRGYIGGIGPVDLRPQVELFHPQYDHQPVDKYQRKRSAHRFQRPAQQQSPLAAGYILHHQKGQSTHGPAECEHQAENPGAQKVIGVETVAIQKSQPHRDRREDHRNNNSAGLPDVDKCWRPEIGWEHFGVLCVVSHSS